MVSFHPGVKNSVSIPAVVHRTVVSYATVLTSQSSGIHLICLNFNMSMDS